MACFRAVFEDEAAAAATPINSGTVMRSVCWSRSRIGRRSLLNLNFKKREEGG